MNNKDKETNVNKNVENKPLEEKVGFLGRVKYMIVPAALTIGTYFTPEFKNKYNNSSSEKKESIQTGSIHRCRHG